MNVLKKYEFLDKQGKPLEQNKDFVQLVSDFIWLMDKLKPLAEQKGREAIVSRVEEIEMKYGIEVETEFEGRLQ